MVMTRFERNQVYGIIGQSDIDVADCSHYSSADTIWFTHKSRSEIAFQPGGTSGNVRLYKIFASVFDGETPGMPNGPIPMDLVAPYIRAWATEIKRVSETPDYWIEMPRVREMIIDIQRADTSNSPFTKDEQRRITTLLHEIVHSLPENSELSSSQIEQIEEKLDEAAEASKYMGRKDWRIYFLGTITALIISSTVPSGVGEHIFRVVIEGLIHLFTGAGGPPQILG